jgi:hypothetical protein
MEEGFENINFRLRMLVIGLVLQMKKARESLELLRRQER